LGGSSNNCYRIDFDRLMKLRLVVARIGEMDNARWWNTNKLLSSMGTTALKRGFPVTYHFAQAKAVIAVASSRSQEAFTSPVGTVTLWNLPAEIEDEFENCYHDWLDDCEAWKSFFGEIKFLSGADILASLIQCGLIDDTIASALASLQRSVGNRAVVIPGEHPLDDHLLTMLAGAYSLSEPGNPVIPYAKVRV